MLFSVTGDGYPAYKIGSNLGSACSESFGRSSAVGSWSKPVDVDCSIAAVVAAADSTAIAVGVVVVVVDRDHCHSRDSAA